MTDLVQSAAAYARACHVMPGGNTRSSNYETPHPIYLANGDGAYVVDLDGDRYLDFQNNFTALIHGHGHPGVTDALKAQVARGLSFSNPTLAEVDLAEILCARVPHFEQVRFTNTGSEAVMMALKAARAVTGRSLIAKCQGAYHGNYDFVEMSVCDPPVDRGGQLTHGRPEHDGVAPRAAADVIVIPFNDAESSRRLLDQAKDRVAAILVDPLPSRVGLMPAARPFLTMLRRWTRENQSLLISDEVLSFRLGFAGALGSQGIRPDLCAFGKIIGGGMPIGAVAGPVEFMRVFDPSASPPKVAHSGTFTANPMSMVAGAAALKALDREAFAALDRLGSQAREAIREVMTAAGVEGCVTGAGSLFRIFLGRPQVRSYADAWDAGCQAKAVGRVVQAMRGRGVMLSPVGLGSISTPMTSGSVDQLADAFRGALKDVAP